MAETVAETIVIDKDVVELPLSETELAQLEACENTIRKGLCTFLEVGRSLAEIHDNRLYRVSHKSFKAYCREIWDLGKTTAEQKINGWKVVNLLEEKMPAIAGIFTNESQTRPLTRLKKMDDRLEAGKLIQERLAQDPKAKLTGAMINKAVKEVKGEVAQKERKKRQADLDSTHRLSPLFKRQCKVMEEIINDERNAGWQSTSQKEAVKWLKILVQLAESND